MRLRYSTPPILLYSTLLYPMLPILDGRGSQAKASEVVMELSCDCHEWVDSVPQIVTALVLASVHGATYTGSRMRYCPWCAKKLVLNELDDAIGDVEEVSDEDS